MLKNLYIETIGKKAKIAFNNLPNLTIKRRNSVLKEFNKYIKTNSKLILNLNKKDIAKAKSKRVRF